MGVRCDQVEVWDQLRRELEEAHARLLDARRKLKEEERALEGVIEKVKVYLSRR